MIPVGSAMAFLDLDTSRFRAGLRSSMQDFREFMQETRSTEQRMRSLANGMGTIGASMTRSFTVPIVGIGAAVTKMSSDFETAFAGVKKTVEGTPEQLAKIRQGILDMEIPTDKNVLAGIAENAGQLGIATDNVLSFTRVMADLTEATNLTAETGAVQFARFANITKMPQENMDRLASTVVALGNNFATTEAEITSMAMRLAGAGSQVGMTQANIMAIATALSSLGIEAEAGGTAFSRIMKDIDLAVATNSDKLEQFANVSGISATQFSKAWKEDAASALTAFIDGLGKAEERGMSAIQVLDEMGIKEIRLSDALLRTAGGADMFTKAIEMGNEAWRENSALSEEVAKKYETFGSQVKMLWQEVKVLAIQFGDILLPSLTKGVTGIRNFVKALQSMSPETKKLILSVGTFLALAGPLMIVGKKTILGFLAIKAGIGTVIPFIKNAGMAVNFLRGGMGPLTGQAMMLTKVFTFLTGPIGIAITLFTTLFLSSAKLRKGFFGLIGTVIQLGVAFVKGLYEKVKPVIEFVQKVLKWLGDAIGTALNSANNALKKFASAHDIDMSPIVKETEKVTDGIKGETGQWEEMLNQAGKDAGLAGAEGLESKMPDFEGAGKGLGESASDGIKEGLEKSKKHYEDLADDLQKTLDKNKEDLNRFGDAIVEALRRKYDEDKRNFDRAMDDKVEKARRDSEKIKESLKEAYDVDIKALEDKYDPRLKGYQDQIDAINALQDAEDKAVEQRDYNNKIYKLEADIANASTPEERTRAERALEEAKADWARKQAREERKAQIERIRAQMEAARAELDNEKEKRQKQLDLAIQAEEERLKVIQEGFNKEKEVKQANYEKLTEQYAISEEARKLVAEGKQQEIIDLLETYYPEWQNVGQTFAEKLTEGLNSQKQSVEKAVGGMLKLQNVIPQQERQLQSYRNQISVLDRQIQGLTNSFRNLGSSMVMPAPRQVSVPVSVYTPAPYNPYVSRPQSTRQKYDEAFKNLNIGIVPRPMSTGGGSGGGMRPLDPNFKKLRSFAKGLRTVPFDDFSANLHKGEAVLTAKDNDRLKDLEKLLASVGQNSYRNEGASTINVRIDHLEVGGSQQSKQQAVDEIFTLITRRQRGLGVS